MSLFLIDGTYFRPTIVIHSTPSGSAIDIDDRTRGMKLEYV